MCSVLVLQTVDRATVAAEAAAEAAAAEAEVRLVVPADARATSEVVPADAAVSD